MVYSRPLPADVVEALTATGIGVQPLGGPLRYFSEVSSTNDVAADLAAAGAADGTTVLADAQRAGRGRLGRTWFSPPGAGLYVSCIFRPPSPSLTSVPGLGPDGASAADATAIHTRLTLATGVALADAVRAATALPVDIKWPNDLVVDRRKLAGILCEGSAVGSTVEYVIVGFGINLRSTAYPREIANRATSLEAELGRPVDRGLVLTHALTSLRDWWMRLRAGRFDDILRRWRELSPSSRGARVEWTGPSGTIRGVTDGIDANGALRVLTGDRTFQIVSGNISWAS